MLLSTNTTRRRSTPSPTADEPNTLKVSGVYELPIGPGKHFLNNRGITGQLTGGWKIGFILDYEQGTPFGVLRTAAIPSTGSIGPTVFQGSSCRPPVTTTLRPTSLVVRQGTTPQAFNPAAFAATANQYVLGDAVRVYSELRNPNSYNESASLEKSFFITERYKGTLKFDYFNLLNRTYFGGVDTNLSDANFGQFSPSVGGNRQGQVSAKVSF